MKPDYNSTAFKDKRGKFIPGNRGGPGRPPKITEDARKLILDEVVTQDILRQLVQKNVLYALGQKVEVDKAGNRRVVEDAKIRDSARVRALEILYKYVFGNPVTPLQIENKLEKDLIERCAIYFSEAPGDLAENVYEQIIKDAYELKLQAEKKLRREGKKAKTR